MKAVQAAVEGKNVEQAAEESQELKRALKYWGSKMQLRRGE
jgi:ribulose 1,5-bisphosphate carboxylase large subunit-like protein